MGLELVLGAVGIAASVAGTLTQVAGQKAANSASKRSERLREQQMNLESSRQRRQIVRNALKARSDALLGATSQGAQGGSGLQGGFGQIGQGTSENMVGVNNAQSIGAGIFQTSRDSADAQSLVAFGSGLSSLGGSVAGNASTISNIFNGG